MRTEPVSWPKICANNLAVEVNNTLIYFVSRPVTPPADALSAALPSLDLSSFLAAVFSDTRLTQVVWWGREALTRRYGER